MRSRGPLHLEDLNLMACSSGTFHRVARSSICEITRTSIPLTRFRFGWPHRRFGQCCEYDGDGVSFKVLFSHQGSFLPTNLVWRDIDPMDIWRGCVRRIRCHDDAL
ncbi:unnamed protein product [Urochloa humidicola]